MVAIVLVLVEFAGFRGSEVLLPAIQIVFKYEIFGSGLGASLSSILYCISSACTPEIVVLPSNITSVLLLLLIMVLEENVISKKK